MPYIPCILWHPVLDLAYNNDLLVEWINCVKFSFLVGISPFAFLILDILYSWCLYKCHLLIKQFLRGLDFSEEWTMWPVSHFALGIDVWLSRTKVLPYASLSVDHRLMSPSSKEGKWGNVWDRFLCIWNLPGSCPQNKPPVSCWRCRV